MNERTTNWTAGPCPNIGWAERVHPELEPEAALDKLWEEVTYVLRLDTEDPVEAWRERMKVIVASADRMTDRRFDSLHLKGAGTDLTIGLLPSSKWLGADFSTAAGSRTTRTFRPKRSSRPPTRSASTATSRRRCRSSSTART